MVMSLADKKQAVAQFYKLAQQASLGIVAENCGLTVEAVTRLRKQARESDVAIKVMRNTLAKRAFQDTDFECLSEQLSGPIFFVFSLKEPGTAARILRDFAKESEQIKIRMIALNKQVFGADTIDQFAQLPTYEEAISKLMAVLQAPAVKLMNVLRAPYSKLVHTLVAIRDEKARH